MSEHHGIKVGETVPDFKIDTYEPSKGDFGEISLAELKANKKWTVLFFYPADFTFV
jgi:alkyl hydroperoxide reductase subunit AhpC